HKLDHLIESFKNISQMHEPILLHVITQKGRGYSPAVRDPENFHGVGKFDRINGDLKSGSPVSTYSDVFGNTLIKLAKNDPRIVGISAAMTTGTGLKKFAQRFPDRYFDVGIAEGHAVTMAAGMALYGLKPVVAIYSTFLQRSYDEIIHDVALQKAPVVFAIDRAGLVGPDGPTHHGVFDLSYLSSIPNMTIMVPRDQLMLAKMLENALKIQGPVAIRYPREKIIDSPMKASRLKIGTAEIIKKGSKAAVFCVGPVCYTVADAIRDMDGIAVVDLIFAKPLDLKTIREVVHSCNGRFIVVEEGSIRGGIGSAVVEALGDMNIPLRFQLLGVPDAFVGQGSLSELRQSIGLDKKTIRDSIKKLL
ncbi:MAG: 1-deoxy-D-xylulose-5-phosphate synthase, partial [Deltaproteobacteria bacterium]|nr:1-deoxy-D-xylulose-5-phosphate synthase [Deltaproteobacteria bacterium]